MAQFYALLNCAPLLRWTTEQTTRCDHEAEDAMMVLCMGRLVRFSGLCVYSMYTRYTYLVK